MLYGICEKIIKKVSQEISQKQAELLKPQAFVYRAIQAHTPVWLVLTMIL
jgi:hypothetical protein